MPTKTKLKFPATLKDLNELPEALRGVAEDLYEKEGDEWVFQGFDESDAKKKLDEFRNTNRSYYKKMKELEEANAKWKDRDPEKYEAGVAALEKLQKLEEKKMLDEGQVEEVFKSRLASATEPYLKQLEAKDKALRKAAEERDDYRSKLDLVTIDELTTRVATKAGKLRPNALPHLLNFGRQTWKLNEERKPVAWLDNGEQWFGKDGGPITPEEWGAKLLEQASFYFEPGEGGGAAGGEPESGVRVRGNVKYIDRNNPTLMAQHAKGILDGTVVPQ